MRFIEGSNGLRVSEVCLGTSTFGNVLSNAAPKEECRRMFDTYIAAGGNFIDLDSLLTRGTSETYIGEFAQPIRSTLVLATHLTLIERGRRINRAATERVLDESLQRLHTDYIDVCWLRANIEIFDVSDVIELCDRFIRSGKVRYVGLAWGIGQGVIVSVNTWDSLLRWEPFIGVQSEYNLFMRAPERTLFPYVRGNGLYVALSPLWQGFLSGKYTNGSSVSDAGRLDDYVEQWLTPRIRDGMAVVQALAKEVSATPAQIALAWLRQQYDAVIPVVSTRTVAQLKENLGYLSVTLSAEQLRQLNTVSQH